MLSRRERGTEHSVPSFPLLMLVCADQVSPGYLSAPLGCWHCSQKNKTDSIHVADVFLWHMTSAQPQTGRSCLQQERCGSLRNRSTTVPSGCNSTRQRRALSELFAEVFTDHVLVYDACLPPHAQPVRNSVNAVNHQL